MSKVECCPECGSEHIFQMDTGDYICGKCRVQFWGPKYRDYPAMKIHRNGVVELNPHDSTATVCGTCLRGWDDSVVTSVTPAPSARCPFEYEHEET